jgi:hypothetical protein
MLAVQPLNDAAMEVAASALTQSRRVIDDRFIGRRSDKFALSPEQEPCVVSVRMSTMRKAATPIAIMLSGLAVAWFLLRPSNESPEPAMPVRSPQQILYEECVAARDYEIHKKTFATIDNPDVQREVLATQKEIAKRECREKLL